MSSGSTVGAGSWSDIFARGADERLASAAVSVTGLAPLPPTPSEATAIDIQSWLTAAGATDNYTFDARGTLTHVDRNGAIVQPSANVEGQYTNFDGNITLDADGRVTALPDGTTLDYDGLGRLTRAVDSIGTTTTFWYDADDQLVRWDGSSGSVILQRLGSRVLREAHGTTDRLFVPGLGDEPTAVVTVGGATVYNHIATSGRLSFATNGSGAVVERYAYDAFGEPKIYDANGSPMTSSAIGNHLLMSGQPYVESLSAYRLGRRWYAPNRGAFLTPDPSGFADGPNRFAFAGGAPNLFIDPTGLAGAPLPETGSGRMRGLFRTAGTVFGAGETLWGMAKSATDTRPMANQLSDAMGAEAFRVYEEEGGGSQGLGYGALAGLNVLNPANSALFALEEMAEADAAGDDFTAGRKMFHFSLNAVGTVALATQTSRIVPGARNYASPRRTPSAVPSGAKAAVKKLCFGEGTPVHTGGHFVPIEEIAPGDRVKTFNGGSGTDVDSTWLVAKLTVWDDHDYDHVFQVQMLRSPDWFEARQARAPGSEFHLEMEEMGLSGWGRVDSVRVVPPLSDGPGRVVLTTVNHLNNDLYEVSFAGSAEPLRSTGPHPLYSLDRDDWVRVRDLQIGERLQTAAGAVTVAALERLRALHRVYNLEVERHHEYLVGQAGIRAHNTCLFRLDGSIRPGANLRGVSLKAIKRHKPKGWRTVKVDRGSGWKWLDHEGTELFRFMRPNGKNPAANQWSRQSNGYFRWNNKAGDFLDIDGNVVSGNHPLFHELTHIIYEGL